jgi:hypothetical protein
MCCFSTQPVPFAVDIFILTPTQIFMGKKIVSLKEVMKFK